jgi:hypothetical protein
MGRGDHGSLTVIASELELLREKETRSMPAHSNSRNQGGSTSRFTARNASFQRFRMQFSFSSIYFISSTIRYNKIPA